MFQKSVTEKVERVAHTPGPWQVTTRHGVFVQAGDDWTIANVIPHDGVREANARLIAAAPDLLAACHAAHSYFASYSNGSNEASEKFQLLGAAIAKAEGR